MSTPQVLTSAQVAERLNLTTAAFHKRHRILREQHGFPPPVPGLGYRYDPEAITAWLARQRQAADPVPAPAPAAANDAAPVDWSEVLAKRAAALAAGRR